MIETSLLFHPLVGRPRTHPALQLICFRSQPVSIHTKPRLYGTPPRFTPAGCHSGASSSAISAVKSRKRSPRAKNKLALVDQQLEVVHIDPKPDVRNRTIAPDLWRPTDATTL